jgi:hypothetical protein
MTHVPATINTARFVFDRFDDASAVEVVSPSNDFESSLLSNSGSGIVSGVKVDRSDSSSTLADKEPVALLGADRRVLAPSR